MLQEGEYKDFEFPSSSPQQIVDLKKLLWKRLQWKHTPQPYEAAVASAGAGTDVAQDESSKYVSQTLKLALRNWKRWCFQKWRKKKTHAVLQHSLMGKQQQQKPTHTHHNEAKECPDWACYRVMKKESYSCGKAAGHRVSKEESSEEQRKHTVTHWASSFHLEKICNKY